MINGTTKIEHLYQLDFIPSCTSILVGQRDFLVLKKDGEKITLEGPAMVGGGTVDSEFLELNDVRVVQSELPLTDAPTYN